MSLRYRVTNVPNRTYFPPYLIYLRVFGNEIRHQKAPALLWYFTGLAVYTSKAMGLDVAIEFESEISGGKLYSKTSGRNGSTGFKIGSASFQRLASPSLVHCLLSPVLGIEAEDVSCDYWATPGGVGTGPRSILLNILHRYQSGGPSLPVHSTRLLD
jgi:hypothetical protein